MKPEYRIIAGINYEIEKDNPLRMTENNHRVIAHKELEFEPDVLYIPKSETINTEDIYDRYGTCYASTTLKDGIMYLVFTKEDEIGSTRITGNTQEIDINYEFPLDYGTSELPEVIITPRHEEPERTGQEIYETIKYEPQQTEQTQIPAAAAQ